jgi:hypothetical protein
MQKITFIKIQSNKERIEAWVAALEDPANEGQQIRHLMHDDEGGMCAMGVAETVLPDAWTSGCELPAWVDVEIPIGHIEFCSCLGGTERGATPGTRRVSVSFMNDHLEMSFWDIAQALRATHLKEAT